jgi:hypothetical protein
MASGHAEVHATPVQNLRDETYSFTARARGLAPSAAGQVEVHALQFTGEQFSVHADVTCISVVGNQAWVGARVTRFVADGQELTGRVGEPMVFRVVDAGEGRGAADLASLVFFAAPGRPVESDLSYCDTRPEFPILRASAKGNLQVKGE